MRLTVWDQDATGLVHGEQKRGAEMRQKIERLPGSLRHGHLSTTLDKIDDIASWIDNVAETSPHFKPLTKAVEACRPSIVPKSHGIPHDGERSRHGAAIAPGFVESTVHQGVSTRFCKKPQRPWSKRGAHLLVQTRVKTLNRAWGAVCKRWSGYAGRRAG
jgi:hypothetical protein